MTAPQIGCWFEVMAPAGKTIERPAGFDPRRDQLVALSVRSGARVIAERAQVFRWHRGRTRVGMTDLQAWTSRAPVRNRVAPLTPLGRLLILDPRGPGQVFTVTLDRWPYRLWAPWYGLLRWGRVLRGWWTVNVNYWRTVKRRAN